MNTNKPTNPLASLNTTAGGSPLRPPPLQSPMPVPVLGVVPYHCEGLANDASIRPLLESLARVEGVPVGDVKVVRREPEVTKGPRRSFNSCFMH